MTKPMLLLNFNDLDGHLLNHSYTAFPLIPGAIVAGYPEIWDIDPVAMCWSHSALIDDEEVLDAKYFEDEFTNTIVRYDGETFYAHVSEYGSDMDGSDVIIRHPYRGKALYD